MKRSRATGCGGTSGAASLIEQGTIDFDNLLASEDGKGKSKKNGFISHDRPPLLG